MEIVEKVWGQEVILVNEPEYGAKVLRIKEGAGSSVHRHLEKKETFICRTGEVWLNLYNPGCMISPMLIVLTPDHEPVTILPGQWHQFHGNKYSEVLEVSTHDDPSDIERRTQSYDLRSTGH